MNINQKDKLKSILSSILEHTSMLDRLSDTSWGIQECLYGLGIVKLEVEREKVTADETLKI
ncbi:hypothetical protein ABER02_13420 [Rossellomorea marisflavi]|uniref:hypothetical protein n=1 Tax=Rossellomorea marisflavi TaxID=189381 RepID=UPI003D29E5FA